MEEMLHMWRYDSIKISGNKTLEAIPVESTKPESFYVRVAIPD